MKNVVKILIVLTLLMSNGCSADEKLPPKPTAASTEEQEFQASESVEKDDRVLKEKENPTGDLAQPGKFAGQRAVKIVDGLVYAFRWAPPGEFLMGSPDTGMFRTCGELLHPVKLTKGFWMLETEVTVNMAMALDTETMNAIDKALVDRGHTRSKLSGFALSLPQMKYYELRKENAGCPIVFISYGQSKNLCEKLGEKLSVTVSLPTEAQWEYACRAGSNGEYGGVELGYCAWYDNNSDKGYRFELVRDEFLDSIELHGVGGLTPNAWGLYDMLGNVSEYTCDCYDSDYYWKCYQNGKMAVDPCCETGSYRVCRGGCYASDAFRCRPAYRIEPFGKEQWIGVRIIVVPE